MKASDWKNVKRHQVLVYAREEIGVVKAEVTEIDVKVRETVPTLHWDYPYGLTKDSGAVKIKYELNGVVQEEVENLSQLITWNSRIYQELLKAYNSWQQYKIMSDAYKETFLSTIQTRIVE